MPKPAPLHKIARKIRRAVTMDDPGYYDMFTNPGERYFAQLYLDRIRNAIREQGMERPRSLKILDAGCQTGRLAIPLALDGHRVTGVDTSGVGLNRCRRHAKENRVDLELVRADLTDWLPRCKPESFDAILCCEVLYLRKNHHALLDGLLRVLKPGGLCFISHRPTGYYLAEAFQHKDWAAVRLLLSTSEGELFGSYYNWQDRETLERTYAQAGVDVLEIRPIGFLSWLAVAPDALPEEGQELLHQADSHSRSHNDCSGRYLFVCGRKK